MQFKDLNSDDYEKVCKVVEKHAKGLIVDPTTIIIDRSGLKVYFMYDMLRAIIVEKKHITFCMGTRPFSNIRLALKGFELYELTEVYKAIMARGQV